MIIIINKFFNRLYEYIYIYMALSIELVKLSDTCTYDAISQAH